MVRWRCNSCGKTYRSNPEKCRRCDHTIFTQYRKQSRLRSWLGASRSSSSSESTSASTDEYEISDDVIADSPEEASNIHDFGLPHEIPNNSKSGSRAAWIALALVLLFLVLIVLVGSGSVEAGGAVT